MKTKEEWRTAWYHFAPDGNIADLIKAIQLDAWKQGMTDAARLVDMSHGKDIEAIFRARDKMRLE